MKYAAGKEFRITRRSDISRVFEQGSRCSNAELTLFAIANALPYSRCGVAAGWRHGKAVQRNRVKRLCREAFRLMRPELPAGWDFMLVPRAGAELTLERLQKSLRKLSPKLTTGRDSPTGQEG